MIQTTRYQVEYTVFGWMVMDKKRNAAWAGDAKTLKRNPAKHAEAWRGNKREAEQLARRLNAAAKASRSARTG